MSIIIEGPDNSGKSTLAKALSDHLNLPIVHAGGPGTVEENEARLTNDFNNMISKIIMDRSYIISETVYASAMGREMSFHPRPWFRTMKGIQDAQVTIPIIIFCDAHDEVLLDMKHHIVKPHETAQHARDMQSKAKTIISAYRHLYSTLDLFMEVCRINPRLDSDVTKTIQFVEETLGATYNEVTH